MKNKRKLLTTFCLVLSLATSGCSNIFEPASNKTSDAALFEDARKLINDQDYAGALAKFEAMTAGGQTNPEVIEAWAGAYAGKCGLDFIQYFADLGSADLTGSTIFRFFMSAWSQKIIDAPACASAQLKLEEISANPAERTGGQNLFMAVLGMVKIGVYLRAYADQDGANNLGDGTPDAAFNVCTNNDSNFPQQALDEVITGLGLVTSNLTYLAAVLASGSITNALNTVTVACASVPGACGKTDTSTITDSDRDLFRDLLKTDATHPTAPLGVGNCVDPLVVPCC